MCETSKKGDLAVAKVIADLTEKGYDVLTPLSEHLKFDLVAHKDGKFFRIQVKYSASNPHSIRGFTNRQKGGKTITTLYTDDDFDYYAIYLADKKCVVYPSICFRGRIIRTELPEMEHGKFLWYEDMLDFCVDAETRSIKHFGLKSPYKPRPDQRILDRPSKEVLEKEVWEMPAWTLCKKYSCSDKTIKTWCKNYGIDSPPRGHFLKKKKAVLL